MPTRESEQRMARRRFRKAWEQWLAQPEVQAFRRALRARQRYRQRHPYAGYPGLLFLRCVSAGIEQGGRPPKARRCRKRLGSRLCWNWRAPGVDRCHRHIRQVRGVE
jgi:hypothetical protein